MIGACVSGLGLFTIARFGGIPVPYVSELHTLLWYFVVVVQALEYIIVFFSLLVVLLGYVHVRNRNRHCMLETHGMDMGPIMGWSVGLLVGVANFWLMLYLCRKVLPVIVERWTSDGGRFFTFDTFREIGLAIIPRDRPCQQSEAHPSRSRSNSQLQADNFNIDMAAKIIAVLDALLAGTIAGVIVCGGVPIMDLSALATIWAVPLVNQKLFVMFIYTFVISTCLRVERVAREYPDAREKKEEFIAQLKKTDLGTHLLANIASPHIHIAYSGLAFTFCLSVACGAITASVALWPGLLITIVFLKFAYKSITFIENFLQGIIGKIIRELTGWFSDMSIAMNGYNLQTVILYPRLYLDPHYRKDTFKGVDIGGNDAGFLSMAHGFGVFFLCVAFAPSTCFGVWVALPCFSGTLPLEQAVDLVGMYWWDLLESFLLFWEHLHWDWPEWLNIEALEEFVDEGWTMLLPLLDVLVSNFLDMDLLRLLEASTALLKLNTVLATLKALAAGGIKVWLCIMAMGKAQGGSVHLISFGDCLPSKTDFLGLVVDGLTAGNYTLEEVLRPTKGIAFTLPDLKSGGATAKTLHKRRADPQDLLNAGYTLKELKEAEFKAKELKGLEFEEHGTRRKIGFEDLIADPPCSAEDFIADPDCSSAMLKFGAAQLKSAGFDAARLKSAGFDAAQLKSAGFDLQELTAAKFTGQQLRQAKFGYMETQVNVTTRIVQDQVGRGSQGK